MSDLTLKAISTYNGNLHNGLTTALEAVVVMCLEEAARVAVGGPCGQPEYAWDYWCGYGNGKRAAAAAIRALKEKPHDR